MYKISFVNKNYKKPYNIEIYIKSKNLERSLSSAICSVGNTFEDCIELINMLKNTNYKEAEAILVEEEGNIENSALILIDCDIIHGL